MERKNVFERRSPSRSPELRSSSGRGSNDRRSSMDRRHSRSPYTSRGFYSRSPSPRRYSSTILIENITRNVTKEHINEIFGAYGTIDDIDFPLFRKSHEPKGYCYVTYAYADQAETAVDRMNSGMLDGEELFVSLQEQPQKYGDRRERQGSFYKPGTNYRSRYSRSISRSRSRSPYRSPSHSRSPSRSRMYDDLDSERTNDLAPRRAEYHSRYR
ncbi:RNA-binding protein [Schizosaccharomyces japonicus yFS275]|uniref:RNA-binding protein n=1 Tax=Schizosaccharomyces japonicus (strain yFS275 / FY16936) TaxID=402676 RepID=B6JWW3_SCHJY|nr:RNA-binding protein [Schizosaccharomyces japonicus yFS275]EEB05864.1 RNA-binding protein [Schizosaccharomyces japonicus yFS275]